MNPLTLLPLLAAAALAAPGAHVLLASQPALTYAQVPLTQTVHYENRPVVTGYSTTVVKPALATAPLAISGIASNIAFARQLPELTPPPSDQFPTPAPPNANSTTPPPIGDAPTLPPLTPPTNAPPSENGTSGDQGGNQPQLPIPGSPILGGGAQLLQVVNPAQLRLSSLAIPQTLAVQQAADAVVVEARSVPVAAVRAAQAGDFEPLVTKEKVLAPVRTHTQITPQLTQIQPEITVRKIVHDVPVAQPVAIQTPLVQQLAAFPSNTILQGARIISA